MSRRDKDKLIVLLSICAVVGFVVIVYYGSKIIPWPIIAGVLGIAHFGFVAPLLCKRYYKLYKADIGIASWIPLYNEIAIMSPGLAKATLIAAVVAGAALGVTFIPNDWIGGIFGLKAGIGWGYNSVVAFVIVLILANFVLGFGLCGVFKDIVIVVTEFFGYPAAKLEWVHLILLMVPGVRICPLLVMAHKVKTLLDSGYGEDNNKQDFVVQEG